MILPRRLGREWAPRAATDLGPRTPPRRASHGGADAPTPGRTPSGPAPHGGAEDLRSGGSRGSPGGADATPEARAPHSFSKHMFFIC